MDAAAIPRNALERAWPYEALGAGGTDRLDDGGGSPFVSKIARTYGFSLLAYGQALFECKVSCFNALVQARYPRLDESIAMCCPRSGVMF